jgi:hypothetical protein
MSYYSTDRLWDNEEQNSNVFNWNEVLEEWNESLNMHPYVQTVIDNLKAVSDPDSEYDFPLSHFLKYLNWEKDGITWFLYEVVSMRWMWGESRLDFVKDLAKRPEVKLDEGFPFFPGSPKNFRTVRKFLIDSLSKDELNYLELPPKMRNTPSTANIPATPTPTTPTSNTISNVNENIPLAPRKVNQKYTSIQIILQRPDQNGKGQPDDVVDIMKESFVTYSITYKDKFNSSYQKFPEVTSLDVLNYVRNIVNLNYYDHVPFQFIQLIVPGAPDVLFKGKMSSEERTLMYDAIQRTLDSWPVNVN